MNARGFTLLESLATLAIISVLFIGLSTAIANYSQMQHIEDLNANTGIMAQVIRDRLSNVNDCSKLLPGQDLTGPALSAGYIDINGTQNGKSIELNFDATLPPNAPANDFIGFVGPGRDVSIYRLHVADFRLFGAQQIPNAIMKSPFTLNNVQLWTVSLVLQTQLMNPTPPVSAGPRLGLGAPMPPRIIGSFIVGTNPGGTMIVSCEDRNQSAANVCAQKGWIYAPLGFTNGSPSASSSPPDQNGCVPPDAFNGKDGVQGPAGQPAASAGPPGQPGTDTYIPVPVPWPVPVPYPAGNPAPPPLPPVVPVVPSTPKWSDARVKTEAGSFEYGLNEALKIRPIWFSYNGLAGTVNGERHAGVIAQELEQVAPKLVEQVGVKLNPDDARVSSVRRVDYDAMTFILLRAVQEQQGEIEDLQNELRRLERSRSTERK